MFTVCPKCALTLVVTAADLRVAQGYVRCGRCSNVFNALARLSEDKGAPGANQAPGSAQTPGATPSQGAAQSQGSAPPPSNSAGTPPKPQSNGASAAPPAAPTRPPQAAGPFIYTKPPETPAPTPRPPQQAPSATQPPRPPQGQGAPAPQATAPSSLVSRPTQQSVPPKPTPVAPIPMSSQAALRSSSLTPSPATERPARESQAGVGTPAPPRPLPIDLQLEDDDDAIPEDALEFNADADVNQFFIEPPPNPEWTAATGTFKSIVLKSEELTPAPDSGPDVSVTTTPVAAKVDPRHAYPPPAEFNSTFEDDEIELDADFLSGTAQMRKLQTDTDGELIPPPRETPAPREVPLPREMPLPREALQVRETPHTRDPAPSRESPLPIQPPPPAHVAPSARMAPRGTTPPLEAPGPTRSRTPVAETPTRAPLKPIPVEFGPKDFPEPDVVSVARAPIRTPTKSLGLEPAEPLQRTSLNSLARSVEANSTLGSAGEPLPPERSLLGSATLWTAGTGAMILLLAIQVVNHFRNDLAATPQFNKPITALYSALGIQLTPRWDLHAYDVRQLGASVDSANAGEIMVRASVKNGARQAQPMPLLRVTLQDRFGNRIAARDVAPGNYLPRATADIGYLPAGQRIDAEMAFVDPGSNAVGFEIDACLPAPAGGIICANDSVSR